MVKPNFFAGERVDLEDLEALNGTETLSWYVRYVLGNGVLSGFRLAVPSQVGSDIGAFDVYNGSLLSRQGQFLNERTGLAFQRISLPAPNREYWIEVEFVEKPSSPETRAFWDSTIQNVAPLPAGQETLLPSILTRLLPSWRVVLPARSNAVGARTSLGYTPQNFSPWSLGRIPIAVLRTDGLGRIVGGSADLNEQQNDLVSVTSASGSSSWVSIPGLGQPKRVSGELFSILFSDQRPRYFERLAPPFLGGASGEVSTPAPHDLWIQDLKSAYDALATSILQIKEGAAIDHQMMGDFHTALLSSFSVANAQAVVTTLFDPKTSLAVLAIPNQYIGCTFQVLDGAWAGFYGRIAGNQRTSAGSTTLALQFLSPPPENKDLPASGAAVRIVAHQQKNWLSYPTPSTNFRGLNALDTEVFDARNDKHLEKQNTQKIFPSLKQRLDGNKGAFLTIAATNSNLIAQSRPADILFDSTSPLYPFEVSGVNALLLQNTEPNYSKGGTVLFRAGNFLLNNGSAATSVFNLQGLRGFVFEGEGRLTTRLFFDRNANQNNIFRLTDCRDITFRQLTFEGVGEILRLEGTANLNIRFEDCRFLSFGGTDPNTPSLSIGGASVIFERCTFQMSGKGIVANQLFRPSAFRDCNFTNSVLNTLQGILDVDTSVQGVEIASCRFEGVLTANGVAVRLQRDVADLVIRDSLFASSITGGASVLLRLGEAGNVAARSSVRNCQFVSSNPANLPNAAIEGGIWSNVTVVFCHFENSIFGIKVQSATDSRLLSNVILGGTLRQAGISLSASLRCTLALNRIELYNIGIESIEAVDCTIQSNKVTGYSTGGLGLVLKKSLRSFLLGNQVEDFLIGVDARETFDCTVQANRLKGIGLSIVGGIGIFLQGSTRGSAIGNQITMFETGIDASTLCSDLRANSNQISLFKIGMDFRQVIRLVVNGNFFLGSVDTTLGLNLENANQGAISGNLFRAMNVAVNATGSALLNGGHLRELLLASVPSVTLALPAALGVPYSTAFVGDGGTNNILAYNTYD